jgi:hypothetical protein
LVGRARCSEGTVIRFADKKWQSANIIG